MRTGAIVTVAALLVLGAPALRAQGAADSGRPAFEVASVKITKLGSARDGLIQPGRFAQTSVTLQRLVSMAYGRDGVQMSGGPNWIDSDRFDVEAKGNFGLAGFLPGADGTPGLVYRMLQTLLAERFKLAVHTEERNLPVYALVLARRDGALGPRIHRSDIDCIAYMDAVVKNGSPPTPPQPGQPPPCSVGPGPGRLSAHDMTMSQVARLLSSSVNRVVVDRTGLAGGFNVELEWTPDLRVQESPDAPPGTSDRPANDGPSIFTALQEQLGLKLESTRAPVDVLVIDRAEQPTEN